MNNDKIKAALESCRKSSFRDIDGDWITTRSYDEKLVAEAIAELNAAPVTPAPQAAPSELLPELTKLLARYSSALSNELIYGEGENASMKRCREYEAKTQAARKALVEGIVAALAASQAQAEPVTLTVEMSQFLTDVATAAGLLSHGKRDNELASRIGEFAFRLMTGTAPAFLAPSAASSDARDAALEEAARICDLIGKDWFDAGMDQKGWAAEYVAQQIRTAMSAPAAGEAL